MEMRRGFKVDRVENEVVDYTKHSEGKNLEKCPMCNEMANVKQDEDYLYYQHVVVKAYGNGTHLNSWTKEECKVMI